MCFIVALSNKSKVPSTFIILERWQTLAREISLKFSNPQRTHLRKLGIFDFMVISFFKSSVSIFDAIGCRRDAFCFLMNVKPRLNILLQLLEPQGIVTAPLSVIIPQLHEQKRQKGGKTGTVDLYTLRSICQVPAAEGSQPVDHYICLHHECSFLWKIEQTQCEVD